jgi:hypothetical protein
VDAKTNTTTTFQKLKKLKSIKTITVKHYQNMLMLLLLFGNASLSIEVKMGHGCDKFEN